MSTSSTEYDELGRRISQTDQAGHTTRYDYDTLGRLFKVTDPMSHVSLFGYDALGEKISQTDANSYVTQFAYDLRGRLVTKLLPLNQIDGRTYDTLGRLATMTDFNGRMTTFGYEDLTGRLLSKTSGAESVTFAYNGDGTRKNAVRTTASGSVTTAYLYYGTGDFRQGQLQSVMTTSGGVSRTISYDYDVLGEKIATQTPSLVSGNKSVGYGYDLLGRLSTVTHPDGAITTFGYDKVGNRQSVTRKSAAGTVFSTTSYAYDSLNRLTDLVNKSGTGAVVSSFHYTLRPDGKRQSVTEASGATTRYTYDDSGKLKQEAGPYATIDYGYDNVGNRITRSVTGATTGGGTTLVIGSTGYAYDANDRITAQSGPGGMVNHSYDDGNETTVNGQLAAYDFENHLVGLGSGATSYVYDADGNRVSVTSGGVAAGYVVDTSLPYASVVEEYSGTTLANGTLAARYDYGDDLIRMDRGAVGSQVASYYLFDGLGSTRQLVSGAGAVTDSWGYSAFGEQASRTGSTVNSFLFNAQQFDQPTGTYFLRARYYDQSNGRFLSQDPYSGSNDDPVTLHRYLYVSDDPTNLSDPSGADPSGGLAGLSISIGALSSSYGRQLTIAGIAAQVAFSFLYPDLADQVALSLAPLPVIGLEDRATVTVGKTARLAARGFENNALAITRDLLGDAFEAVRSTPEDFRGFAQQIRSALDGQVGKLAGRNLAFGTINIPGLSIADGNTILGLSGDFDVAGFASRLPEGFEGSAQLDSEIKIFNQLLALLRDQNIAHDVAGDIILYSERRPCASCQGVVQQFSALYPHVNVHVVSSNLEGKIKIQK